MTPEQFVRCIDFRYITDALTPDEALEMLRSDWRRRGRRARRADASATAIPAYTTSAGWLGYSDDKLRQLCREALAHGLARISRSKSAAIWRTTCAAAG